MQILSESERITLKNKAASNYFHDYSVSIYSKQRKLYANRIKLLINAKAVALAKTVPVHYNVYELPSNIDDYDFRLVCIPSPITHKNNSSVGNYD